MNKINRKKGRKVNPSSKRNIALFLDKTGDHIREALQAQQARIDAERKARDQQ